MEVYIINALSIILKLLAKKHSWFWGYRINLYRPGQISPLNLEVRIVDNVEMMLKIKQEHTFGCVVLYQVSNCANDNHVLL